MSEVKVNKISPRSGTDVTLGDSSDTFTVPTGVGLTLTDSTLLLPTTINTDKLDPKSGTALEIGTSGDTITVPTGAGLTVTDEVKTNKISPATGVAFSLGDSGDTFTVPSGATLSIPSGATITNAGTATGFGDTTAVENDIATLALHQATNANAAKYNLVNTNVDQFEDSTGIASLTDCERDTDGEYISTIIAASGIDANTVFLMHMNNSLDDSSGNSITCVNNASVTFETEAKFGSHSCLFTNANYLSTPDLSSGLSKAFPTTGDFTVDFWYKYVARDAGDRLFALGNNGTPASGSAPAASAGPNTTGTSHFNCYGASGSPLFILNESGPGDPSGTPWSNWRHYAVQRTGTTVYAWIDGFVLTADGGGTLWNGADMAGNDGTVFMGGRSGSTTELAEGYMDEFRVSSNSRYTGNSAFTPETSAYAEEIDNATGNFVSTATTANASVTTMGAVILYKNEDGVNALNTDIVLQVSADGGSNYTTATLTAGGTFSTGILQAVANDITVTAGTSIQYKLSFANQSAGVKEAQIYGVSLMY